MSEMEVLHGDFNTHTGGDEVKTRHYTSWKMLKCYITEIDLLEFDLLTRPWDPFCKLEVRVITFFLTQIRLSLHSEIWSHKQQPEKLTLIIGSVYSFMQHKPPKWCIMMSAIELTGTGSMEKDFESVTNESQRSLTKQSRCVLFLRPESTHVNTPEATHRSGSTWK